MIKTHMMIMDELKEYASPKARLTRLLKAGSLVQIRRGLFVDDTSIPARVLSPVIYGPSYISFQYALADAGLIPERVPVVTAATFNKNKDRIFRTPIGEYRYMYLPKAVYPWGITMREEAGMSYLIATPEKALCDSVYKMPRVTTIADMETLLLDDWRMEREDLLRLDTRFIAWIAPIYHRASLVSLAAWFEKGEQKT